ncbi:MAG TPA: hydroxyisourate hydrolase [Micromonosporaceae bacterium]|nr:hydroxyisourate hydrolase [Micromonosporaceae bacterium]
MSLSTHVLDTARGEPAAGIPVRLHRLVSGQWSPVADGLTDADGRLRDWVPDSDWGEGRYRLVFETGGAFFPEVVVVFEVSEPGRPCHVPLLLSPYGYTTYRGT